MLSSLLSCPSAIDLKCNALSTLEQACKLLILRDALATNQKVACSSHAGRTTLLAYA